MKANHTRKSANTTGFPIERLRRRAEFLSAFEREDFRAGEIIEPREVEPKVFTFPYARLSEGAEEFVKAAYESDLVLTDFDWIKWAGTPAAKKMRGEEASLAEATPEQLVKLLTACIRADRFVEGSLLSDFESGLILRIVRRAAALLDEVPSRR